MSRSIIVTGATKGIGRAVVDYLMKSNRQVHVFGVGRTAKILNEMAVNNPHQFYFVAGDCTDDNVIHRTIEYAHNICGHVDALFLNAGTIDPISRIESASSKEFCKSLKVNFISLVQWAQSAIPHLRATNGRIIYTSSTVVQTPMLGWSAYSAAKCAANMFIKILAKEEPMITLLAVHPGIVATEAMKKAIEGGKDAMHKAQYEILERMMNEGKVVPVEQCAKSIGKLILNAPKSKSGEFVQWNEEWIGKLSNIIE